MQRKVEAAENKILKMMIFSLTVISLITYAKFLIFTDFLILT